MKRVVVAALFFAACSGAGTGGTADGGAPDGGHADAGSATSCTLGGHECASGQACRPGADAGTGLACGAAGAVPAGGACDARGADDCAPGAVCADPWGAGSGVCLALCTLATQTVPCPSAAQSCLPLPGTTQAGVCVGDACTPPATGCPAGQRCGLFRNQVLACQPAGGVDPGGDCEHDACKAGGTCVTRLGSSECHAMCSASAPCAGDQRCIHPAAGLAWGYCDTDCDPVSQSGCDAGESCYYSDPEAGSTVCWRTGTLAPGADCSSLSQFCPAGWDCFPDPGSTEVFHCRQYCDATHPCSAGSCQSTDYILGVQICR